eukprot:3423332-Prymnesium_polylepis.1
MNRDKPWPTRCERGRDDVGFSWVRAARATHLRELGELDLGDRRPSFRTRRQVGMVEDHSTNFEPKTVFVS